MKLSPSLVRLARLLSIRLLTFQTAIIIVLLLFTVTLLVTMSSARERPLKYPSSPPTVGSGLKVKGFGFLDAVSSSATSDDDEELGLLANGKSSTSTSPELQNLMLVAAQADRRLSRSSFRPILHQIRNLLTTSSLIGAIVKVRKKPLGLKKFCKRLQI